MINQTTFGIQSTAAGPRFPRDKSFDSQFDKVQGLIWYPFVGKRFGEDGARIMVYAHNAYVDAKRFEEKKKEWEADKESWANSNDIDAYTYDKAKYTNAFRYFIKGAVGLNSNYCRESDTQTIARVDSFVERIAYLNFIQAVVKSDNALTLAEPEQIERSKIVNREILRILDITHCICWGKPTYEYVRSMTGFKCSNDTNLGKSGFSSSIIDVGAGKMMQCLRIYHPSMPGFGPLSKETHSIISSFLAIR